MKYKCDLGPDWIQSIGKHTRCILSLVVHLLPIVCFGTIIISLFFNILACFRNIAAITHLGYATTLVNTNSGYNFEESMQYWL